MVSPGAKLDVGVVGMLNAFKVFVALDRWAPPGAKLDKEVVMAESTTGALNGDVGRRG